MKFSIEQPDAISFRISVSSIFRQVCLSNISAVLRELETFQTSLQKLVWRENGFL